MTLVNENYDLFCTNRMKWLCNEEVLSVSPSIHLFVHYVPETTEQISTRFRIKVLQ